MEPAVVAPGCQYGTIKKSEAVVKTYCNTGCRYDSALLWLPGLGAGI